MEALETQVREALAGITHRIIGRILYDMGFLILPQIEQIMSSMGAYSVSMNSQSDDVGNK